MQKTKIAVLVAAAALFGFVKPAFANVLSIQQLPTYINTNSFKLSCTVDGGTYQFEVSKNGGAYTAFGPSIDTSSTPCVVQVNSGVVNDQTSYTFRIGGKTTSTTYDSSGPSPVSGYYKERVNDGMYKLHFHTPSDGDFASVIIYRGDAVDFSADAGHKIGQVNGGANSDMTYDDNFAPDPNKTYYYDLRAVDKAGNSSSLAGDGSTTTTTSTATSTPGPVTRSLTGSGASIQLPGEGSVLGTEATPTPEATAAVTGDVSQNPGILKWILTHKKISLGVLIIIFLLGYNFYKYSKRQ